MAIILRNHHKFNVGDIVRTYVDESLRIHWQNRFFKIKGSHLKSGVLMYVLIPLLDDFTIDPEYADHNIRGEHYKLFPYGENDVDWWLKDEKDTKL